MRTAVDSSVLWCLINREPPAAEWKPALRRAVEEGELLICPIVFAEIAPAYPDLDEAVRDLGRLQMRYDEIFPESAFAAGAVFKAYRAEGGPRESMIPDFLIASHAQMQADRLAAVDRGYLRRYFPSLKLLTP